jgi:type I restriction enzyme S subunit
MKDSGIEWLGEIPEHWEVKKLKYIAINISKGTTPSTIGKELVLSGSIRYIKAENIVNNSISSEPEYFIDEETNEILSRSQLKENDILFVIAGATLGKVAILRKEFLPANTNQAVSFIRFHWTENHRFVWYWLQSSRIIELTWLDAVQSAQPNLSMESLGNFHVPYPPLSERNEIVRRIDETLSSTNRMIQRIEQEIVLLQEYRTALISEVVTGKVDVREWARYEQSDEQELMRAAEKTSNYKSR